MHCLQEDDDVDTADMEEDIDGDLADIENLNYDDLDSVSKLQKTQRFVDIMQVSSELLVPFLFSFYHFSVVLRSQQFLCCLDCALALPFLTQCYETLVNYALTLMLYPECK